jgi:hypothetical protein
MAARVRAGWVEAPAPSDEATEESTDDTPDEAAPEGEG